jgi:hypothetical protein
VPPSATNEPPIRRITRWTGVRTLPPSTSTIHKRASTKWSGAVSKPATCDHANVRVRSSQRTRTPVSLNSSAVRYIRHANVSQTRPNAPTTASARAAVCDVPLSIVTMIAIATAAKKTVPNVAIAAGIILCRRHVNPDPCVASEF